MRGDILLTARGQGVGPYIDMHKQVLQYHHLTLRIVYQTLRAIAVIIRVALAVA